MVVAVNEYVYQLFVQMHGRQFLLAITYFLGGAIVILWMIMVVHKFLLERQEQRQLQCKSRYLADCLSCLGDVTCDFPLPSKSWEWKVLADVLIYLEEGALAERRMSLQQLSRRLKVSEHLVPQLQSRFWRPRLESVERLGLLRLPENLPVLRAQLLREQDLHVVTKLLWSISLVGEPSDLKLIMSHLGRQPVISSKFNEHLFQNLLESLLMQNLSSEAALLCEQMLCSELVPAIFKRDLIEACGGCRFLLASPAIVNYFQYAQHDPACVISCLRALGEMGGDPDGRLILPALGHADWRVRAVAARAAMSVSGAYRRLFELLGDASYQVRMNAASALVAFGAEGRALLEESGLASQDRFVRDISFYMLREY